jgi:hypothetical protein
VTRAISEVAPGKRFRLPHCGKTGEVLSHGAGGSRVKYDSAARRVQIKDDDGNELASFDAPGKPVVISSASVVEVL